MKHKKEDILLKGLAEGSEYAFTELYDHYHDHVERFIRKYLKSEQLSEDICQNVFVSIWEQRTDLGNVLSFGAFAFTIAKRQSINFLKRASVEQNALSLILSAYNPYDNQVEDQIKDQDYQSFIQEVLNRLPPQTQKVFDLCRQQKKTYDEAAEILGISRNAIKKHMMRAIKTLGNAASDELGIPLSVILIIISSR